MNTLHLNLAPYHPAEFLAGLGLASLLTAGSRVGWTEEDFVVETSEDQRVVCRRLQERVKAFTVAGLYVEGEGDRTLDGKMRIASARVPLTDGKHPKGALMDYIALLGREEPLWVLDGLQHSPETGRFLKTWAGNMRPIGNMAALCDRQAVPNNLTDLIAERHFAAETTLLSWDTRLLVPPSSSDIQTQPAERPWLLWLALLGANRIPALQWPLHTPEPRTFRYRSWSVPIDCRRAGVAALPVLSDGTLWNSVADQDGKLMRWTRSNQICS